MNSPTALDDITLSRVLNYIEENLDGPLEVSAMADLSGMSPSCFARLFQQRIQLAPHAYVVKKRVERARQLLLDTDIPIAEIALEVGFSSQACLNVAYKLHFGETPGSLRQKDSRKPKDVEYPSGG